MAYATKAFLCRAMAALAHEEGMHLDVATGGELHVALAAGVPAERLVLHGNNKSTEELRRAREAGVGRIVVDSFDELDRLDALHAADGLVPPGAAPGHARRRGAHPRVRAHRAGRLEVRVHAVDRRGRGGGGRGPGGRPSVELVGLHMHIGSQVFVADYFRQAVEVIAPFVGEARPARAVGRRRPRRGLREGRGGPDAVAVGGVGARGVLARPGVTARVTAEPGRSIAAAAAVTLYTVGTVKEIPASAPTCRSTAA